MSFLMPLYVLGLLAISLPIVFHFIRRAPRGEFPFSSLMFLSPSPPRLTRRSRLDHLLLLLLRGLALALLAFAFARPFLLQSAPLEPRTSDRHRLAIVVDSSASMRRGDLWQQATEIVDQVLAECGPYDQPALFLCDESLWPLTDFDELADAPPGERRALVRRQLAAASPTWSGTHLGQGLLEAVEKLGDVSAAAEEAGPLSRRIVLVTDLQEGSRLGTLAEFSWPTDVELDLRAIQPRESTNAGLHRVAESRSFEQTSTAAASSSSGASADSPTDLVRARVSNDAGSAIEHFQLHWRTADGRALSEPLDVYVPAGESRVVRVPPPPEPMGANAESADSVAPDAGEVAMDRAGVQVGDDVSDRPSRLADRLEPPHLALSGDAHDFDNALYFAPRAAEEGTIVYLGEDAAGDPTGLRYYLERAMTDGSSRPLTLVAPAPDEPLPATSPASTPLVVVTSSPPAARLEELRAYVEQGGTLLFVLLRPEQATALSTLLEVDPLKVEEAAVDRYAMLGKIAFNHPLFVPMASPQFNDFTQIHFWKYRRLDAAAIEVAEVLASFENGDPALVERRLGGGAIYVLTSGWHPGDSQLARSWKFVLLVAMLAEDRRGGGAHRAYFQVNERLPLRDALPAGGSPGAGSSEREGANSAPITVVKPDGTRVLVPEDFNAMAETDLPGVYVAELPGGTRSFAVNLDPNESKTEPLDVKTLEQLGCRLVDRAPAENNVALAQRLADAQLESRQKIWQWLIAAALGLLIAETWLAGRISKATLAKPVSA